MSNNFVLLCFAFMFSLALTSPTSSDDYAETERKISACERSCPITFDYQPKCGSDGITYGNQKVLECRDGCLKPYGRSLHKVSDGLCPLI